MENQNYIQTLFGKYLDSQVNETELNELLHYFQVEQNRDLLTELIEKEMSERPVQAGQQRMIDSIADKVEAKLFSKRKPAPYIRMMRIAAAVAAIVILVISVGLYLNTGKDSHTEKSNSLAQQDLPPGGQRAILTLSGGQTVDLTAARNGEIAVQSGSIVTKTADGRITYNRGEAGSGTVSYNTITTPKGGEYQLQLPDGTLVWLNAGSSLKYPASFASLNERAVELKGEAYFEVARDKAHPFRVVTQKQIVEVLGTHFNIMAYADEQHTAATLLQGSIKIAATNTVRIIKPGEQAIVNEGIIVREADMDAVMAWKNGRTYFKDADIPAIMRSLGRWYNVEVEYRGEPGKELFTGGISRRSNLSGLLKILESGGIHASMENGKLIVSP